MYEEQLNLREGHRLVQTEFINKSKSSEDTDTIHYDEFDKEGVLVAKYIIKDVMSKFPPFSRAILCEKYAPNGDEIEVKNLKI